MMLKKIFLGCLQFFEFYFEDFFFMTMPLTVFGERQ